MRIRAAGSGAVVLAVSACVAGCGTRYSDAASEQQPPVTPGQRVTVQFRRDALGSAMSLPVSPTTGGINGAEVAVSGRVEQVRPGWLLLKRTDPHFVNNGKPVERSDWIPLTVVLMIEID